MGLARFCLVALSLTSCHFRRSDHRVPAQIQIHPRELERGNKNTPLYPIQRSQSIYDPNFREQWTECGLQRLKLWVSWLAEGTAAHERLLAQTGFQPFTPFERDVTRTGIGEERS